METVPCRIVIFDRQCMYVFKSKKLNSQSSGERGDRLFLSLVKHLLDS